MRRARARLSSSGMSSPAQVARGARLPALPAPLAMIAGALSVQLGGAVAVHAFTRSTPLGVTFLRSLFATPILLVVVRSLPRTRAAWRAALPFGGRDGVHERVLLRGDRAPAAGRRGDDRVLGADRGRGRDLAPAHRPDLDRARGRRRRAARAGLRGGPARRPRVHRRGRRALGDLHRARPPARARDRRARSGLIPACAISAAVLAAPGIASARHEPARSEAARPVRRARAARARRSRTRSRCTRCAASPRGRSASCSRCTRRWRRSWARRCSARGSRCATRSRSPASSPRAPGHWRRPRAPARGTMTACAGATPSPSIPSCWPSASASCCPRTSRRASTSRRPTACSR